MTLYLYININIPLYPWVRKIPWRRAWQPTSVFLPGESHGQRSLAGYSLWGHKSQTWLKPLSMQSGVYICTWMCVCGYTHTYICIYRAALVVQTIKNLPAMQETQVRSLGQEDPLEKGMATHSSFLAWEITWTEEPSELQSVGLQRVRHDWMTNNFNLYRYINWVHYHTLTLIPPLTTCYFCHVKTVLVLTTHLDLRSGHQ